MKKLLLILFFSQMTFAQDKYTFTPQGLTDYVVTECPGKTQSELYKKALDWVAVTFKNSYEVIQAQIENDYIRIEGSSESLYCLNIKGKKCFLAKYQIEISFKDGRYKFDFLGIQNYTEPSESIVSGWSPLSDYPNASVLFKNGEPLPAFKYLVNDLPEYLNHLNVSLKDFEMGNEIPSKKGDW